MFLRLQNPACTIALILAITCVTHQEAAEVEPGRRIASLRLRKPAEKDDGKIPPEQYAALKNEILQELRGSMEALWRKIAALEQQVGHAPQGTKAANPLGVQGYPSSRKRRSTSEAEDDEEVDVAQEILIGGMETFDSVPIEALAKRLEALEGKMTKTTARSCEALRKNGFKNSGKYLVDPDGADFGEAPIEVHCEFLENGESETSVFHEYDDGSVSVETCGLPGCSAHPIKYKASSGQIDALKEISLHCEQDITYNCFSAPLSLWGNLHYSWWIGSDGKSKKHYWSGGDNTQHVCECGLEQNCLMAPDMLKCNCDAGAPEWLSDQGILTDKDSLPIRSLHFGGLRNANQKANFTLGPLKCAGANTAVLTKFDSCRAMKVVGHHAPGYYLLNSTTDENMPTARVARCNFDLHVQDTLYEETMLKFSSPVVFSAVHSEDVDTRSLDPCCTRLTGYDDVKINRGAGFDGSNGTFTSPVAGIYFFSFQANAVSVAFYQQGHHVARRRTRIHKNDIVQAEAKEYNDDGKGTITLTTVLELSRGDVVHVSFRGRLEAGEDKKGVQFMGFLLHPS